MSSPHSPLNPPISYPPFFRPSLGPDGSEGDVREEPRDRVRNELREKIVRGLAESAGKESVAMQWGDGFAERIVCGEEKMLEGWPKHIPFGELCRIPGGLAPMQELLDCWNEGTLRWRDATPEELHNARHDPRSVLPNTPLPRRRPQTPPPSDATWIVGSFTTFASNLNTVIRCKTPPARAASPSDTSAPPPAKRRHVDKPESDASTSALSRRIGQRRDINTVRVRRFRNRLNGVQTSRYVLQDDSAPGGCMPLDDDLGRALERGSVVVSGVRDAFLGL